MPPCLQNPKPIQKPHPPLIFGGESRAAFRRVAEVGQGWFGFGLSPPELAAHLEHLDEHLASAGRSRADVQVHVAPPPGPRGVDALAQYRELGADQVILQLFARDADQLRRRADALAERALR